MQEQIQAIKQLLEANNAIASQIDRTIVDWLGDSASWENASTYQSIAAFDSGYGSLPDCLYDSSPKNFQALELLWRSRADLNDARINAEEVDLGSFLTHIAVGNDFNLVEANIMLRKEIEERDREIENLRLALDVAKKPTDDLQMECDQLRRDLRERDAKWDSMRREIKERDRTIQDMQFLLQDARKNTFHESANPDLIKKIAELRDVIEQNKEVFAKELRTSLDLIAERDRQLEEVTNHHSEFVQSLKDALKGYRFTEESEILTTIAHITTDYIAMVDELKKANESDRQIQELQINLKNHREQFDSLKSHFEVLLKAIAMNLNALKGERKGDHVETVDGVEIRYRRYDDNLTHRQKTILVEAYQVAIAEEARKLKDANLKDFSFDDIPF